ncbi:MAG: CYTH domain-containing protein [Flavobacteriales bacterium]
MKEIERKFLVENDQWKQAQIIGKRTLKQGYLLRESDRSVRIRMTDNMAFFTVKLGVGISRSEFEYEIPVEEAQAMITEANLKCLEKTRFYIQHNADTWELDVFHGALEGLVIAELELESEDQLIELPSWVGKEVTLDPNYLNANLIERVEYPES